MNITVAGIGYVGLSNALILSRLHQVVAYDVSKEKVEKLNNKISPIDCNETQAFLDNEKLDLISTINKIKAYKLADFVIISTPTNYDSSQNSFDTSSVEEVIKDVININSNAVIIIKSTIPIGYTKSLRMKFSFENIFFSPEFLREDQALFDSLNPSRIIIGGKTESAIKFVSILLESVDKKNIDILFTSSNEAEAVKLFSNSYLAMRIAFFNELDSYAETNNLNSMEIIKGIGLDSRIGLHYNNPSFGYGGYCLPKDTKQLHSNFQNVPNKLIAAIVESNDTRKNFIANSIKLKEPKRVGVYRLIMKHGSDNFRESSVQDVMKILDDMGIEIIVFEPRLNENYFYKYKVIEDIEDFKNLSSLIIANRLTDEIKDVKEKIYSRDLFGSS